MRVLQNGTVLAHLTEVHRQGDRLTAVWNGPPPPFEPSGQLEPVILESEDGLEREDAWLCRIWSKDADPTYVEFGAERNAPAWRRGSAASSGGPSPSPFCVAPLAPDGPTNGGAPGTEPEEEPREPKEAAAQPAKPLESAAVRTRVLVVDDDADVLDVLAESLEVDGWTVQKATGGKEALLLTQREPPDVAVIDLIMPEVSGEDVCRAIRCDPRLSQTRILVLSAAEDARIVAAQCDADGAITKPFTIALLLHEVRRLAES